MGGLFSRLKTWSSLETVQKPDLNGEFDNIINNLSMNEMSGWSATVAQMKLQTAPGSFGSESLSTSQKDELERIRYQLNAIIGGTNSLWYDQPALSISQINSLVAPSGLPQNRIESGRVDANGQPMHLVPGGSTKKVTIKGASTPLILRINNADYTFSTDITSTDLSLAPSTQNTFTLNDTNMDLSAKTKNMGDYISDLSANLADGSDQFFGDYSIVGSSCGTNISALLGSFAAFKYTHSAVNEYFIGYVSAASGGGAVTLTKCMRGCFFDSTDAAIPSIAVNNTETVTLMNLAWVYVTTAGAFIISYTNPRYSPVQPTSFASGDMWYDTVNQQWKQSNGSVYSAANCCLVGVAITDTANCIGARSFDWFRSYSDTNNVIPELFNSTEYRSKFETSLISVYGSNITLDKDYFRWVNSANLDSGVTLSSGNTYYGYISPNGTTYISNQAPHRRLDLQGYYHPSKPYRCALIFLYNSSGNFDANVVGLSTDPQESTTFTKSALSALNPTGSITAYGGTKAPPGWLLCDGTSYLRTTYSNLYRVIGGAYGTADSTHFNVPDLRGRFIRGTDNGAGNDPNAGARTASNTGGNTGDKVGTYQVDAYKSHQHDIGIHVAGATGSGTVPLADNTSTNNGTGATNFAGGSETRPVNVSCNYIIKT